MQRFRKSLAVFGVAWIFSMTLACDERKAAATISTTATTSPTKKPSTAPINEDIEFPMAGWDTKSVEVTSVSLGDNRLLLRLKNTDGWLWLSAVKVLVVADGETCEIEYRLKNAVAPNAEAAVAVPIWFGAEPPPHWYYRMIGGSQIIKLGE